MEDKKKLKQLTKQAEEENAKLEKMRNELQTDPEYAKLEQAESDVDARQEALRKKREKIENRIRATYLMDDAYGAWYDPKGSMYHRTNILPLFMQAIKDVVGNVSKLRGSDVETIINNLMHEEMDDATTEIRSEQEKLTAEAKELYNKRQALERARLNQQSERVGELIQQATELKQKLSPQGELEAFRKKAVAPETLAKIRQRAKEILKEQKHS